LLVLRASHPHEKVPPVPGLAVHTAFKCNVCIETSGIPHFTLSSNKVRDHKITYKIRDFFNGSGGIKHVPDISCPNILLCEG
jgi:hypothetical protein